MGANVKRIVILLALFVTGFLWSGLTVAEQPVLSQAPDSIAEAKPAFEPMSGELLTSSRIVSTGTLLRMQATFSESTQARIHAQAQQQQYSDCPSGVRVKIEQRYYCLYDDGSNGDFRANDGIYSNFAPVQTAEAGEIVVGLFYGTQELDNGVIEVRESGDIELLVLTDWEALYEEFLDTGMAPDEDRGRCSNGTHDFTDLVRRIEQYTTAYSGTVIDLPSNITAERGYPLTRETAESGCSGNYKDILYQTGLKQRHCKGMLIDELISEYAGDGTTQNIVILGNDEVVPFYRVKDPTDYYGEVSGNPAQRSAERGYMLPPPGESQQNPVLRDINQAYLMSDVPYSIRSIQKLTRDYPWLEDTNNQKRPQPEMGIGRIFDLRPCDLIQAINRYDQPLMIEPGKATADIFVGSEVDVDQGGTIDFKTIIDSSFTRPLGRWFEDGLDIYDPDASMWMAATLREAFFNTDMIIWAGHANHSSFFIDNENEIASKVRGVDLQDITPAKPVMLVGLADHMGLSLSDHTDNGALPMAETFKNSLVNPLVGYGHGVTMFAPTSYAYGYGKEVFPDAALHERMAALYVDHLLDYTIPTVGDLWQRLFSFYTATYPEIPGKPGLSVQLQDNGVALLELREREEDDGRLPVQQSDAGAELFHIAAAYGVVQYGLPTQKVRSSFADMCPAASQPISASLQMEDAPPASSMTFDADREEIQIDLPEGAGGHAVLAWTLNDLSGSALASNRMLVNLDVFTQTGVLTHAVDITGWPPIEDMFLDIHLRTCAVQQTNGELANLVQPRTVQIEKGTLQSIQLKDEEPQQEHRYLGQDAVARWQLGVYDREGQRIQEDLSENFHLLVNGEEKTATTITRNADAGIYTVELPLSAMEYGVYVVRIEVSRAFTTGSETVERKSSLTWQVRYYDTGIRVEDRGVRISTGNPPYAIFEFDVVDEDGQPVVGLTKAEGNFGLNVNGNTYEYQEDYTVSETSNGHYEVMIALSEAMGTDPWIYIQVTNDAGYSDRMVRQLHLSLEPIPSPSEPGMLFLPAIRVASSALPACNSFEFSDIPHNQQALQWVNSCCAGSPQAAETDVDDYYLVELQAGQTITMSLADIPVGADYDLVLYDQQLEDFLAFSTRRGNKEENVAYTVPSDTANTVAPYYIRVMLYEKLQAMNRYRLCVEVDGSIGANLRVKKSFQREMNGWEKLHLNE